MTRLPAVSLAAVPGRRLKTIEIAKEIEQRGFPGIFGPSLGDSLSLCNAIALSTTDIMIGTSITPIYTRNVTDFAQTAAFLHEVSNGRFRFGVGRQPRASPEPHGYHGRVSRWATCVSLSKTCTQPRGSGDLPPIVLATLRDKMIQLAEEIGGGMVFA
jgi:alkanesulfonate monooxygenase SsuD/methylene tetrahydromethanopterin reductase-like flavin-dependent oxidoreductase (luciferase family)